MNNKFPGQFLKNEKAVLPALEKLNLSLALSKESSEQLRGLFLKTQASGSLSAQERKAIIDHEQVLKLNEHFVFKATESVSQWRNDLRND